MLDPCFGVESLRGPSLSYPHSQGYCKRARASVDEGQPHWSWFQKKLGLMAPRGKASCEWCHVGGLGTTSIVSQLPRKYAQNEPIKWHWCHHTSIPQPCVLINLARIFDQILIKSYLPLLITTTSLAFPTTLTILFAQTNFHHLCLLCLCEQCTPWPWIGVNLQWKYPTR